MYSPDQIDAVVFDMGGVFVVPNPDRINHWLAVDGVTESFPVDTAIDAHYVGVRAITELLTDREVSEADFSVWGHYDRAAFRHAGFSAASLDGALATRDRLRRDAPVEDVWTHRIIHNIEAFALIAQLRPVAIVTNNNGTAVQQCIEHGICQLDDGPLPRVAAIVDSAVIDIAKPDPRIFAPALDALGTKAERTLYVGDTVHADVLGARAAGMPVVQLDPLNLHHDHDHWRLPDLAALLAALQV